jgi:Domain of unknown function (DUF4407)
MKELLNYQSPEITKIDRLFLWASGTDLQILRRSTYSDKVKLFCLGGIILATGVLAALAGGYAFYTIFSPKEISVSIDKQPMDYGTMFLSVLFGAIWGYIILNLDKYIVSSTGKGDGTEAITPQEWKNAIPRIILGAAIAMTISQPLEIRIFQSEINAELKKRQAEYATERRTQVDAEQKTEYADLVTERTKREEEKKKIAEEVVKLKQEMITELTNSTRPGFGDRAKRIKDEAEDGEKRIESIEKEIADYNKRLDAITAQRTEKYKAVEEESKGKDGLLERIRIAHEIGGGITFFIMFLFLALELTPIFFKLMIIKSPYDYLEENVHEIIKAREAIEHRSAFYSKENDGFDADFVKYHSAEQLREEQIGIIEAQMALTKQIIDEWKAKKSKDISNNLEHYVNENPKS